MIIIIIIIIIIMSLFKEDDIFSTKTNLTYGPLKSKTYIYMVIYICTKYDNEEQQIGAVLMYNTMGWGL